mmetsp:Transcript_875/g.2256  ORF Transcript_875/g.2256 Transcript_875/m.2256 type:complete len:204 (-) Transcript_875:623-1234(-)
MRAARSRWPLSDDGRSDDGRSGTALVSGLVSGLVCDRGPNRIQSSCYPPALTARGRAVSRRGHLTWTSRGHLAYILHLPWIRGVGSGRGFGACRLLARRMPMRRVPARASARHGSRLGGSAARISHAAIMRDAIMLAWPIDSTLHAPSPAWLLHPPTSLRPAVVRQETGHGMARWRHGGGAAEGRGAAATLPSCTHSLCPAAT